MERIFSDNKIIFRDNFSSMICVGFSRKIIINENSKKLSQYVISSISIVKCRSALVLCLFLNIMNLVLSIFSDSLFSLNQLEISLIHCLLVFLVRQGLHEKKKILVSSAKVMKYEEGNERGRSLMYKRNKSGPRIDPCGTPHTMSL